MFKKFIGDRAFYRMLMAVVLPIVVQNGITNFVSLLDNIMVGRIGTESMSGVAIVNQLIFVFNITVFGAISGPGIFTAQFFGRRDHEGVRHTFRMKLILSLTIAILALLIFTFAGGPLCDMYLSEGGEGDLALTRSEALKYLSVMLIGLVPFAISQSYASTLREIGETLLTMKASTAAVLINLAFNSVLIYGLFGFPALGVVGAAIATVISRYVELIIIVLYTHTKSKREDFEFIRGAYKSLYIPISLIKKVIIKGTPLLANETLWSVGMALLAKCYSERGIEAVAAYNICSTITNLFNVVYIALGAAIAIIVGNRLGAGDLKGARDVDTKLIAFAIVTCAAAGIIMAAASPFFPLIYKTTSSVRHTASALIAVSAIFLPVHATLNSAYFTLRSGGKTYITFFMDSLFVLAVNLPVALLLVNLTSLNVVTVLLIVQLCDVIRAGIGLALVKSDIWIHTL